MQVQRNYLLVVSTLVLAFATLTLAQGNTEDVSNHPLSATEKGGMEETGPYEVVPDHFKPPLPDGWVWGPVAGIHAESPDRIYVYSRGMVPALPEYMRFGIPIRDVTTLLGAGSNMGRREHILTVYDHNGNLLEDWKDLDAMHQAGSSAHRLHVDPRDPEKHVWLIDVGLNRILKVTREGKIVMTVGPAQGFDPTVGPAAGYQDMAFLPNGDFFAVESSRVVKFSKDGTQLLTFGRKGTGLGELMGAHAIAIDRRGRIYVGEGNGSPQRGRIQVFDQKGKTIDVWPNIRFGAGFLAIDINNRLWIADGDTHRIAGYDLNGRLHYTWGTTGVNAGQLYGVSQFDVDSEGNLYMVEHYGGRIQMFRPKEGANPEHFIGRLLQ